jgi:hypothetical protein
MPELTPSRVPAGTYPSLLRHYETVGLYNFAVAHVELPDDLVYNIVRVVFEKHEEMMEVHAAAAATVPANLERNTFFPFTLAPFGTTARSNGLDRPTRYWLSHSSVADLLASGVTYMSCE